MPLTPPTGVPSATGLTPWVSGSGSFILGNQINDGSALGDIALATATAQCDADNRNTALSFASIAQVIAQTAQLVLYYDKASDAIDARDDKMDAMQEFQEDLNAYDCGVDFEMVNCKKAILADLGLPGIDMCSDATRYASASLKDGEAVDCKSDHFADQSCEGIPDGWGTHDGSLYAGRAGSYAGGIIANASKRRVERFREHKTNLTLRAQQAMKAAINSNTILSKYAQATSIHTGLADLFIQGFNSAGAGLGVALGQLSGGSSGGGVAANTSGGSVPIGNSTGGGAIPNVGGFA